MKTFILSVAILLLGYVVPAEAQDFQKSIPTVSVNGSAQVKVTPDVIYMSISLDESDTKGKLPLEEQRRNMFSALKKCGINIEKQLSVQGMSSVFFRKRGSLSSTQYELKVSSADEARRVIETLDECGIPNVNITRATSSKLDEYRTQARQAAIRDAQRRASELAKAIGQSIGACYEINDYSSNAVPETRVRMLAKNSASFDAVAEQADEPEVEFEQITINYNLSAKFYLNTK